MIKAANFTAIYINQPTLTKKIPLLTIGDYRPNTEDTEPHFEEMDLQHLEYTKDDWIERMPRLIKKLHLSNISYIILYI